MLKSKFMNVYWYCFLIDDHHHARRHIKTNIWTNIDTLTKNIMYLIGYMFNECSDFWMKIYCCWCFVPKKSLVHRSTYHQIFEMFDSMFSVSYLDNCLSDGKKLLVHYLSFLHGVHILNAVFQFFLYILIDDILK